MNSKSNRGGLDAFLSGKGFYIVLFMCAAVIGVSAWMLTAGDRRFTEELGEIGQSGIGQHRTETVILPPLEQTSAQDGALQEAAAPAMEETESAPESTQVWREQSAAETPVQAPYAWPVSGELERGYSQTALGYDVTMRDWRTHAGIDIAAALGATVTAAHAGTVESVRRDDLLGTVVTVSHGDGVQTVYANLADVPAVTPGEWVDCGSVIGAVGDSALGEIGQGTHLHFAMRINGVSADPLAYLP